MAMTEDSGTTTLAPAADDFGDAELDWATDDEILACGLENPDECEACQ